MLELELAVADGGQPSPAGAGDVAGRRRSQCTDADRAGGDRPAQVKAAGERLEGVLSSAGQRLASLGRDGGPSAAVADRPTEICCDALTIPEASPASAIGASAIAIVVSGRNDSTRAEAKQRERSTAIAGEIAGVHRPSRERGESAAAMRDQAGEHHPCGAELAHQPSGHAE